MIRKSTALKLLVWWCALFALGYFVVASRSARSDCAARGGQYICGEHRCFCFVRGAVLP